ncbi:hypothetical protein H7913_01460 [Staphylococcus hominis]|nr:hypothetical protein [Staphylococcus hominis]MBC3059808.1 hypothetical protein [Staphylococcus hominis]
MYQVKRFLIGKIQRSYSDLYNLIALTAIFNVALDQLVKGDIEYCKY